MWSISNNGSTAEGVGEGGEGKSACSPTRNNRNRFSPSAFSSILLPKREGRRTYRVYLCAPICVILFPGFSPDTFPPRLRRIYTWGVARMRVRDSRLGSCLRMFNQSRWISAKYASKAIWSKESNYYYRKYLTRLYEFILYYIILLHIFIFM